MDGKGLFNFADGSVYFGTYKADLKHGKGVHVFANGDKYDGEYKNGKQHGIGVYQYANGDKYNGTWKDDKMDGYATYTMVRKGLFENGKLKQWIGGPKFNDNQEDMRKSKK